MANFVGTRLTAIEEVYELVNWRRDREATSGKLTHVQVAELYQDRCFLNRRPPPP